MELKDYLSGDFYIICICEGNAEEDIINWLLDENKLIFTRANLISHKITKTRSAKNIEREFLGTDYAKEIIILRVLDSKKEIFKLGKLYENNVHVRDVRTIPEIEILMIIHQNDYQKFSNLPNTKPSKFAKQNYGITNIKSSGTMRKFFSGDINALINSIKKHKTYKKYEVLTINDLLKR